MRRGMTLLLAADAMAWPMQDSQIVCQLLVNKLTLDPHPRVLQTFTFQIFLPAASTSLRNEAVRRMKISSCSFPMHETVGILLNK